MTTYLVPLATRLTPDRTHPTRQMMPLLLVPLDCYNDAAMAALRVHRQQFLFTELEAELNLIFDNLLFTLSDQVIT